MRKASRVSSVILVITLLLSLVPIKANVQAENVTKPSEIVVTDAIISDKAGKRHTKKNLVKEQEIVNIELAWQVDSPSLLEEGDTRSLKLPKDLTYIKQSGTLSDGMGSFQVSSGAVQFTFKKNYQMEPDEKMPDYSSAKQYQGTLKIQAKVPAANRKKLSLDFGNQVVKQIFVKAENEPIKESTESKPSAEKESKKAPKADGRNLNELDVWVMRSWQVSDENKKEFTKENPPTRNDNINIDFKWELDNEVKILDKDFYTFQLEDYFAVHQSISDEPLVNETGGPSLGTFDLATSGLLTIKFNENAEGLSNRNGTIQLSTELAVDEQEVEIITEREIDDEGNVNDKEKISILTAAIKKSGTIKEGKEIVWEVIINDNWRKLSNVKVTDFVGANHKYKSYTCQIQEKKDGEWKDAPSGFCFRNLAENNHVFNFPGLERDGKKLTHPVKFIIRTEITNAESSVISYSNHAAIEGSNFITRRVDATVDLVDIENYKFLYDSDFDKGILNWRIKATINNDNGTIVDQMCQSEGYPQGALHYLDESSLKLTDAKGDPLPDDAWNFIPEKELTHEEKIVRFGIQFKKKGVYYLNYTTKAFKIPLPVDQKVINKLWIEDKFYDGSSGITDDDLLGVVKDHNEKKIDYTKREIPWTTTINLNKVVMKNAEITDLYSTVDGVTKSAHRLIEDSLKIFPYDDDKVDEDHPLKKGTDFDLKVIEETSTKPGGFVIQLKGEKYASTDKTLEIRYNTRFYMQNQGPVSSNKSNYFRNSARVKYRNEQDKIGYDSDEDSLWVSASFIQNGWKYGTFVQKGDQYTGQTSPFANETAQTDTVYWSVPLNIWQIEMKKGTVINETLAGDQSNAEIKIYKIKDLVNADGIVKLGDLGAELKDRTDYEISKDPSDPRKFDIKLLKDINEIFAVFVKVDAGDETYKYENRAFIDLGDVTDDVDLTASVEKSSAYNWLSKTGEQLMENQQSELEAKYTIILNRDGRTVKNTVVTDTLVTNQQTFQRVGDQPRVAAWTSHNDKGEYTKDDPIDLTGGKAEISNDLSAGTQTLTLSLGTITSPILIEYYTKIDSRIENGTSITNSAQLSGMDQEISKTTKNIVAKNTQGSGTSTGVDGSLIIHKKDENNELIENGVAIFDLFAVNNTGVAEEYLTDIHVKGDKIIQIGDTPVEPPLGKIGNLRYGKYAIKETKAPDGYELDDTVHEITIDDNTPSHEYIHEHKNKRIKPFELSILKQDENGNRELKGGEFSLYESDPEQPLATAKTEDNGIGKFIDDKEELYILQLGKTYKVKETKAPDGFVKLKGEFAVTISSKGEVSVKYGGDELKENDVTVKKGYGDNNSQIQFTARNNVRMPLPKTGGAGWVLLAVLGLAAIVIALGYYFPVFPVKKRRGRHEDVC